MSKNTSESNTSKQNTESAPGIVIDIYEIELAIESRLS